MGLYGDPGNRLLNPRSHLGSYYENGWEVSRQYIHAYKWYNLAISFGKWDSSVSEEKMRDLVFRDGTELATKMTPDQIAEAQKLAREWVEKHK